MTISLTGTRQHPLPVAQLALLRRELEGHRRIHQWMYHGGCVGADEAAHLIWRGLGGLVHLHPGHRDDGV